jgi:TrmH family RNA methyltransferase
MNPDYTAMSLSKSRIKYINALKIKKYRQEYGQYVMEGDKMVGDLLRGKQGRVRLLVATEAWLAGFDRETLAQAEEVVPAGLRELERISSLETPPPALAVLDLPETVAMAGDIAPQLCLALDAVQDPGNLGTIIRTADWFGITMVVCGEGCADCYNPKAVQASMGALLRVKVVYTGLPGLLNTLHDDPAYPIVGAVMEGLPFSGLPPLSRGMLLFGNESRGIGAELLPFLTQRVTIPPGAGRNHVESLNVASAVAVLCSKLAQP